jgi:hypothetical protein
VRLGIPRALTAPQQFMNLRANPISQGDGKLRARALQWRYRVSPSPISREYDARLEFKQGDVPRMFIDAPDLNELANGRILPHVYQQSPPQLCLYLPRTGEWRPWMRLDQTVVPWTVLWLYYFEDWLATGEWRGVANTYQLVSESSRLRVTDRGRESRRANRGSDDELC